MVLPASSQPYTINDYALSSLCCPCGQRPWCCFTLGFLHAWGAWAAWHTYPSSCYSCAFFMLLVPDLLRRIHTSPRHPVHDNNFLVICYLGMEFDAYLPWFFPPIAKLSWSLRCKVHEDLAFICSSRLQVVQDGQQTARTVRRFRANGQAHDIRPPITPLTLSRTK